jgi:hypothetical protein
LAADFGYDKVEKLAVLAMSIKDNFYKALGVSRNKQGEEEGVGYGQPLGGQQHVKGFEDAGGSKS